MDVERANEGEEVFINYGVVLNAVILDRISSSNLGSG